MSPKGVFEFIYLSLPVSKYLDGELSAVEHICCMAHVRARFQKALLQGKDELARPFMEWIGRLYNFERDYARENLPPDEIKKRRNGAGAIEIVSSIWMELTRLLDDPFPKGDLLAKALNYLKNAWTPVMATVYHTFIATCKMSALFFYQFLKSYFIAFMEGRTDFENLTPAILGKTN